MALAQHLYQAIGEIRASLVVASDGATFLETDSARYPASIPFRLVKKYQENYHGQQVYWRVYPITTNEGLAFTATSLFEQPERGQGQFVLQGDWVASGQLQIWRNAAYYGKINPDNWQPKLLAISWDCAHQPDDAFWQLKAQLVDGTLEIVAAQGPFPHPPRLETPPTFKPKWQRLQASVPPQPVPAKQKTTEESINWEELTPVIGKLELTIKINTLPEVKLASGHCHFQIDCDGIVFQVSVTQKQWNKLESASKAYAQWVAALAGKLGAATADGFVLDEPNIQVFERSSKQSEPKPEAPASTAQVPEPEVINSPSAEQVVDTPQTETTSSQESSPSAGQSVAKAGAKSRKIGKFRVEVR